MIRILFWNVNKKDLTPLVCSIAGDVSADIVILNENTIAADITAAALRERVSPEFEELKSGAINTILAVCPVLTLRVAEFV